MNEYKVISADSHIVEPADFWTAHMAREFLERAPRARIGEDGTVQFVVDGKALGSVGAPSQAGLRFDDPAAITFEGTWDEVRPGSSDPAPRFEDMSRDGVSGEVIFPTLGARLYAVVDGALLSACCRAGNDWLVERFAGHPNTFKPVALLNVQEDDGGAGELERAARAGLSGAMIPTYPGEDHPYHLAKYARLWAAAQDHGMPLCLHVAACCKGPGQRSIFTEDWQKPDAAAYSATQDYWVRRSLGCMIFAGALERFPGLKIAVVEHELSWLPYFLRQLDFHYQELSQTAPYRFRDGKLPSDFFRDQIHVTFQEDKLGLETLPELIGTDTLMFGSDYPHAESTWPHSRQFLEGMLGGVSEDIRHKLVCGNVSRLFGFQ